MGYGCKCFHHWVTNVFVVLLWLSAFGFWWLSWKGGSFLWMDAEHLFKDVVILGFLIFTSKFCKCCGKKSMDSGSCGHEGGCKCGDCGKCC